MEELTIEQMTSLKGGQFDDINTAVVNASDNTAAAVNLASNSNTSAFSDVDQTNKQRAKANAGNILAYITQSIG